MPALPTTVYPQPVNPPEACSLIQAAAIDTAIAAWTPETAPHTYQLPLSCSARSASRVVKMYEAVGWQVSKTYVDGQGWLLTFHYLKKG